MPDSFLSKAMKKIAGFNLCPKPIYHEEDSIVQLGILETYLFVISFIVSLVVIGIYYSVTKQTIIINEENPSLETYLSLHSQYKVSLTCPCTQLAIPYQKFLVINPSYHQYCSSYYNTEAWYDIIAAIEIFLELTNNPTLISPTAAFRALIDFCRISQQTVNDSLTAFYSSNLVSGYTIAPDVFKSQAKSIIDLFTNSTVNSFKKSTDLLRSFFNNDQVLRGAHGTNFYGTVNVTRLLQTTSLKFGFRIITTANNTPCYCLLDSSCVQPAYIQSWGAGSQLYLLPGVYVGCSIIESLFVSTLQAFYDSAFIASLNIPSSIPIVPLNSSATSKYTPNTLIGLLIEQLFVEDWNANQSFEQYYTGCQPSSCSYTVQNRRQAVEVITAILGIIGGLRTVLSFVVPFIVEKSVALIKICRRK